VLPGETPQSTCTVTFDELAAAGNVTCGPYITLSCPLCNSTAATLQSTQSTPSTPQQPFCNSTVHLTALTGTLTDGSPSGADYAPGSFCQWLIDPGYKYVLAHIWRFCRAQQSLKTVLQWLCAPESSQQRISMSTSSSGADCTPGSCYLWLIHPECRCMLDLQCHHYSA